MTERTVAVRLTAITEQFQAKMAQAGASTKLFHQNMKTADTSAKGLLGSLGGVSTGSLAVGAGMAVATAALVKFTSNGVKEFLSLAGEVRNYQRVSGETAEDSSRMVAALHAVGLNAEVGSTAMFRLSQNVAKHADVLASEGVQVVKNAAGNVDLLDTLLSISDAYRKTEDPAKRNQLVMDAFGRSGVRLLPILAAGRDRLQEFWNAAAQHHAILSDADLEQAREYKLAVHELGEAWKGFERELGQDAIPLLSKGVAFLSMQLDGAQKIGDFFGRGLGNLTGIHLHHASAAHQDALAVEATKEQMAEAEQSAKEFGAQLDVLAAGAFGLSSKQDAFNRDLINFTDTVRAAQISGDEFASSLDANTTTGLANREMLQGLVTDILATAKAARDAAASQGQSAAEQDQAVADATVSQRIQLGRVVDQLGLNNEAVRNYTDLLSEIDGTTTTSTVDLEDADAKAKLDDFIRRTADIPRFIASTIVLDARLVKDNEGVPNGIASPALLDARKRIGDYLSGGTSTPSLDQALAGRGPQATAAGQKGSDDYLRALHDREEEARRLSEDVSNYLKAVYEHEQEIEDVMYRVGDMSTDKYLDVLHKRLAGLEEYSAAWERVYNQIKALEGDTLDSEIKLIQAFQAGLDFQRDWDALAGQRMMAMSGSGSSISTTSSTTFAPTYQMSTTDPNRLAAQSTQMLRNDALLLGG